MNKRTPTPWLCKPTYNSGDTLSAIYFTDTSKGGVHIKRVDNKNGEYSPDDAALSSVPVMRTMT